MNLKKAKAIRKFVKANFKYIGLPYMDIDESGGHLEKYLKRLRPKLAYVGIQNKIGYEVIEGQIYQKKTVGTIRLNPDCVRGIYQMMKHEYA